jgi:16S rRNA (cytosine967-C5)-methyltransferase
MTPAARYQASIELWDRIETQSRVPMDSVCGDYFRTRRFIGSKDRANIAERVYNMMRAYARLQWWCMHLNLENTARARVIICGVLIDNLTADDFSNLFNGNKYHPDILTDNEIVAIETMNGQTLDHDDMSNDVRFEYPTWAADKLQNAYGDDLNTQMESMMHPATLDIRVNTLKLKRDDVQKMLLKDEIETDASPYSPVGLRLKSKAYLAHSKAFKKGMIEIQDEGSQLLALICNAQAGQQVLDYCAGGGGKTLALAAAMNGKGRIVAMDIDDKRLAKSKPRLTKADVHNVELRPLNEDKHRKWLRRQKNKFDIVLVDAPCSSSGTWRRNPDLRWHHYGPTHEDIEAIQTDILSRVWENVKIGGRLVYATCSMFREENENQVEVFLKAHDNFKIISAPTAWADAGLDDPCPVNGDYLRLSPLNHNTDGFFAAVLERTA